MPGKRPETASSLCWARKTRPQGVSGVCGNGSRRREHYASSEIAKRVFPGECTVIPGLWFAYGHDASVAAIGRNLSDKWVSMVLGTVS